jgi:hypothetical protein
MKLRARARVKEMRATNRWHVGCFSWYRWCAGDSKENEQKDGVAGCREGRKRRATEGDVGPKSLNSSPHAPIEDVWFDSYVTTRARYIIVASREEASSAPARCLTIVGRHTFLIHHHVSRKPCSAVIDHQS